MPSIMPARSMLLAIKHPEMMMSTALKKEINSEPNKHDVQLAEKSIVENKVEGESGECEVRKISRTLIHREMSENTLLTRRRWPL